MSLRNWLRHVAEAALFIAGLTAGIGGCRWRVWGDSCADFPKAAVPQPAGTYQQEWQMVQAAHADQDRFVFYQYEWQRDDNTLGPFGRRHLERIVADGDLGHTIVVEPSGDDDLDAARRETLASALLESGWASAMERVAIAHPKAEPLYGAEAPVVVRGFSGNIGGNSQGGGGQAAGLGGGGANAGGGLGGGGVF